MKRTRLFVLLAAATAAAGAAAQTPDRGRDLDLPLAGELTHPDFAEKPNGDDLANYYPPLAQMMGASGSAKVECHVEPSGDLTRCEVVSEQPLGLGFGRATLNVSSKFKMKPQRLDGAPIDGVVTIPIRWQLPNGGDDGATVPSPPVGLDGRPPRSGGAGGGAPPGQSDGGGESLAKWSTMAVGAITKSLDEDGLEPHPTERAAAVEAIKASSDAIAPRLVERQAQAYAAHLSDAELTQAVAFYESPAGKALVAEQRNVATLSQGDNRDVWRLFAADARLRFCQKVSCADPPTAAPSKRPVQGAKPLRAK